MPIVNNHDEENFGNVNKGGLEEPLETDERDEEEVSALNPKKAKMYPAKTVAKTKTDLSITSSAVRAKSSILNLKSLDTHTGDPKPINILTKR